MERYKAVAKWSHSNCMWFLRWRTHGKQDKIHGNNAKHLASSKLWDFIELTGKKACKHTLMKYVQEFVYGKIESRWKICWILYSECLFKPKIYICDPNDDRREQPLDIKLWHSRAGFVNQTKIRTDASSFILLCNPVIYCVCSQQSSRQLLYIVNRKMLCFSIRYSRLKMYRRGSWMSTHSLLLCNVCFKLNAISKWESYVYNSIEWRA